MEIKLYNEDQGWEHRDLNGLIRKIHSTLDQCGIKAYKGEMVSLSNISFKIRKDRHSRIMDYQVLERDGQKGLNFLKQEFKEWISETYVNPGEAWKEYPERWRSFLNALGEMDYSYNQRINDGDQINRIIQTLIHDPDSRQAYLSIYDPRVDSLRIGGDHRMIPCILGYHFTQVERYLDITVMARSIDANNCLMNDIWLADRLLNHIVEEINNKVDYEKGKKLREGSITFMVGNLHSYPDICKEQSL